MFSWKLFTTTMMAFWLSYSNADVCPEGWRYLEWYCYYLGQPVNRSEAEKECSRQDSQLLNVSSTTERHLVKASLPKNITKAWIDGSASVEGKCIAMLFKKGTRFLDHCNATKVSVCKKRNTYNGNANERCPVGWKIRTNTGTCYHVVGWATWIEAQTHCKNFNGTLIMGNSTEENKWIKTELLRLKRHIWIEGSVFENHPRTQKCAVLHFGNDSQVLRKCNLTFWFLCQKKASETDSCPNGWKENKGSCYHLGGHANWSVAQNYCMNYKSHLLNVSADADKEWIESTVLSDRRRSWTGLTVDQLDESECKVFLVKENKWFLIKCNEKMLFVCKKEMQPTSVTVTTQTINSPGKNSEDKTEATNTAAKIEATKQVTQTTGQTAGASTLAIQLTEETSQTSTLANKTTEQTTEPSTMDKQTTDPNAEASTLATQSIGQPAEPSAKATQSTEQTAEASALATQSTEQPAEASAMATQNTEQTAEPSVLATKSNEHTAEVSNLATKTTEQTAEPSTLVTKTTEQTPRVTYGPHNREYYTTTKEDRNLRKVEPPKLCYIVIKNGKYSLICE